MLFLSLVFTFLLVIVGSLFAILTYNSKSEIQFYISLPALALALILMLGNYSFYFQSIQYGTNPISLFIVIIWITGVGFLIFSKAKRNQSEDDVTDSFLDDVINSEDEWDGEL